MAIGNLLFSKLSVTPWAIHPNMFDVITNVLNKHVMGQELKIDMGEKVSDDNTLVNYQITNERAIVPMHGIVMKRSMGMEGCSGMYTTFNITNTLYDAVDNPKVKEIILDFDSPGGVSDGIMETAALIRELGQIKPIIAYANGLMASAAYWLGSATSKIYTYFNADIGSIGVYLMHVDQSKFDEANGIKVTYIKAGKYKTIGNSHEPLSEEATSELQKLVNKTYSLFISDVAKYRGKTEDYVAENIAEGRIFMGEEAVEVGLADGIMNLDGLINPSNTYSFLTKRSESTMLGFKKVSEITMEELQAENMGLYEQAYNAGRASVEDELKKTQAELNELKSKAENANKIRTFAQSVNQSKLGEELIGKGVSVQEAYEAIAMAAMEEKKEVQKAFQETAPKSAGPASSDEVELSEPKSKEEAMNFIRKRDNCSKAQAWTQARKEFANFFYNDQQ